MSLSGTPATAPPVCRPRALGAPTQDRRCEVFGVATSTAGAALRALVKNRTLSRPLTRRSSGRTWDVLGAGPVNPGETVGVVN